MIGLRSQVASGISLQSIDRGEGSGDVSRAKSIHFTHTLQVGTSGLGVIRLHPDDMRAPCRAGPGAYRWAECRATQPLPSRFNSERLLD
jgi:hypothetical protein